jgi:DNA-binding GntR family transcriptional regulator
MVVSKKGKKRGVNGLKQPLAVTAYEQICRKIIILEYKPGQVLDEKELMADLGLGRTPIREALLRLAGEGWVESQPNRGAIVPSITLQGTKAIFEAMKILEVGVADLVICQNTSTLLQQMTTANAEVQSATEARNILRLVETNHAFHLCFAHYSQNKYLIRSINEVMNKAKRLAYLSYANEIALERSLQQHYASVVQEHENIIECLRKRDEIELKETIIQHINTFQQRIIHYMSS